MITTVIFKIRKTTCVIKRAVATHFHDFQQTTNMLNILVSVAREVPLE